MELLIQAVFLPIVLSPVAYYLGKKIGSKSGWFAFAVLFYATTLIMFAGFIDPDYLETYPWKPIGEFGLKLDGLSLPFAATIYILAATIAVYSIPYMKHRIDEDLHDLAGSFKEKAVNAKFGVYYLLYMLYAAGMLGTVLATNLIQFYIFFELMLLPSFLLIAEFGYGDRNKISFLYFVWTHVGAVILLGGLLTMGFLAGTYDTALIQEAAIGLNVRLWVTTAFIIGLFVKLAAFGLHVWLPHAHAEAPTPISALLSPAMIGIGAYAIIRFLIILLPDVYHLATLGVAVWGLITMVYGGLMALTQDDIKRLLAYSSISQMGYIIFGLSSAFYIGVSGSAFHYVSHGTGKAILFMVAGAIIVQTGGLRSIKRLGGLASRTPLTASAAMIGFLVIIGVPPMNGFQSEWMIFLGAFAGALQSHSTPHLILTFLALASTPITAGYSLLTMKRVFFGKLPDELKNVQEPSMGIVLPLLFLAFVSIVIGIFPAIVTERLIPLIEIGGGK